MHVNAFRSPEDAKFCSRASGYAAIVDGLQAFDRLGAVARARHDAIERSVAAGLAGAPDVRASGHGSVTGGGLAAAFATYAQSNEGRASLNGLVAAASGFFGRLLRQPGPEQLRLPLTG